MMNCSVRRIELLLALSEDFQELWKGWSGLASFLQKRDCSCSEDRVIWPISSQLLLSQINKKIRVFFFSYWGIDDGGRWLQRLAGARESWLGERRGVVQWRGRHVDIGIGWFGFVLAFGSWPHLLVLPCAWPLPSPIIFPPHFCFPFDFLFLCEKRSQGC